MEEDFFKEGDHVVYHPTGASNTMTGVIEKIIITDPESVGGRQTMKKASEDMPRYVINF